MNKHPPKNPPTTKTVAQEHRLDDDVISSSLFDNPLWDIRKTSIMLSVSQKTLRDWVYKRQIPFKKVGSLVRFDPSAIRRWIDERNNHGN